jgi:hypothetical protein
MAVDAQAQSRTRDDGLVEGYSDQPIPLRGYATLLGAFLALVGGFLAFLRRSERELPERIALDDVALLGIATYKATRLASKDLVTTPLRAPFTRFEELAGPNEVTESAREGNLRQAIGELLICPYCLGTWVAAGFVSARVVAPRATRFAATILTVHAISDELYNRTD